MINNLDNISIFYLIIISILPSLILYYEKKNYSKDKQYNISYYLQWTLISFILIIFGVSLCNDQNKVENRIIVGPME